MPVILNDGNGNNSLAAVKLYTPKFFNSALTGSGKAIGILCQTLNPAQLGYKPVVTSEHINCRKEHYTNGQTKVNKIPVNPLIPRAYRDMSSLPVPDKALMVKMAEMPAAKTVSNKPIDVYTILLPHSVIMEETDLGSAAGGTAAANGTKASNKSKKVTVCYQLFVYACGGPNDKLAKNEGEDGTFSIFRQSAGMYVNENHASYTYAGDVVDAYASIFTKLEQRGCTLDRQAVVDYLNNFSIYDAMVKRSEEWQTTIDQALTAMFENVKALVPKGTVYKKFDSAGNLALISGNLLELVTVMTEQLEYLETYPIPLDLYKGIYDSLKANFDPSFVQEFCKHNLNLLLSDTLNNLNTKKPNLTAINLPANPVPPVGPNGLVYSPEQARAISCTDPLVLVQSGAGTGKSSVILGRVDWMIKNGVNPQDVMIISFTNAAADHIMTKNPYIQSMTIAKMIHTIYALNFPDHELSTAETLSNTIDIYFPNDPMAAQFRKRVSDMENKHNNDVATAYTQMNNFVERHLAEILKILDAVHQTTLALEIIICYQMINRLKEPPEIASKYLIIDEVQDNSVFEFIYALKYCDKHNEALFIVGDCSQTLYEFRASNPRALNVLEGSGIFTTHKLQINYRSNQEILDFANVLLDNIEANQYARIQLQANSLATVTEKSFTDAVKFQYHRCLKIKDIEEDLPVLVKTCVKPYVEACINAGEQVAFLAYQRKYVKIMQEQLEALFPNALIADITSTRADPSTLFSGFIQRSWRNLQFAPTKSLMDIVITAIQAELAVLAANVKQQWKAQAQARQLYNWAQENRPIITSWQTQFDNGQISLDQFLEFVKDNMLQYEIKMNAIKQAMLSSKKKDKEFNEKVEKANIIMSTVHGAKGLEFPHVVVLFQSTRDMAEDQKRIYYVALTRAMKSEYVLAYDTVPSPKVKADYETIIATLHQRHPMGHVPVAPLVTGIPTKNQPNVVTLEDLQNGTVIVTPGRMPDPNAQPTVPAPNAATAPSTAPQMPKTTNASAQAPTSGAPMARPVTPMPNAKPAPVPANPAQPTVPPASNAKALPPIPGLNLGKLKPPAAASARTVIPQTPPAPAIVTPAPTTAQPHQVIMPQNPSPAATLPAGFKLSQNYLSQRSKPLTPQSPTPGTPGGADAKPNT